MADSFETQENTPLSHRGDQTRQRLLDVATDIFGKQSYDSTSTRNLADASGVNLSAIPYYFGGKQGLYLAVADDIAAQLQQHGRPLIEQTRQLLSNTAKVDREQLLQALQAFMSAFTEVMVGGGVRPSQISFLIHEQLKPTEAFDRIYAQAMQPIHSTLSQLVGRLINRDADDPETILRAHALIGQALSFIMARSTLMRRLNCQELDANTRQQIVEAVAQMSVAALKEPTHG